MGYAQIVYCTSNVTLQYIRGRDLHDYLKTKVNYVHPEACLGVERKPIGPYSRKRNNFSPGVSLTSQTWFVMLLFWKLVLPAKNAEYFEER